MTPDYRRLINDAITQHSAIVQSLIGELNSRIGDPKVLPPEELDRRVTEILTEYEGIFSDQVADTALQAYLRSAGDAAASIPARRFSGREMTDLAEVAKFPKTAAAIQALSNRGILTAEEFYALDSEQRDKHFTVSGQHSEDVIERIQTAITEILAEGPSIAKAKEMIAEAVAGEGSPLSDAHLETVYRVAVNQSYHDGLERVLDDPIVGEAFPYLYDSSIADGRRTKLCQYFATAGIDGTSVYRADDPVYAKLKPVRHFNCRCNVFPLTIKDAAKLGVGEAEEWLKTGQPPKNPFRMQAPPRKLLKQGQGFVAMGLTPIRELMGARAMAPSPAGIKMGFRIQQKNSLLRTAQPW